jgi:hypothetical protein
LFQTLRRHECARTSESWNKANAAQDGHVFISIDGRLTRKEMARTGARPSDKMPMLKVI